MPRKRKGARKRRESSGNRWKRNRASTAQYRALGVKSSGIHQRIDIDSLEFACLFTVIGGTAVIGPEIVHAFDRHGQRPGEAIAPNILQIGRTMGFASIDQIREDMRVDMHEEKKQKQVNRLLSASVRDAFGWYRQDVPDQSKRSVLCGSNEGKDPTRESDSLVVCYKAADGRYHVAEEQWDGAWSGEDADGHRERVGVELDPLPVTFYDEHEAQAAISFAAKAGELERFADREDASHMHRIAARLQAWKRGGCDMKQTYG